jgi:hypothetical protein
MADPVIHSADLAKLVKSLALDVREFVHGELAPLTEKHAKLAETLDSLATICEQVPQQLAAIEQRLRALEGNRGDH